MNVHTPQPLSATERIPLLDQLRGFALLGVLLANLNSFAYPTTTGAHGWSEAIADVLISTKFITLLTILFGAGFYFQYQRLKESGQNFKGFYLRRMIWLFVIGTLHAYLLWYGDILRIYAIAGALLLLFPLEKEKAIRNWALAFAVPLTALAFIAQGVTPYLTDDYPTGEEIRSSFAQGSYLDIMLMNWRIDPVHHFYRDSILTLAATIGKMLIGVWLARRGFFHRPENFPRLRKTWIWSGLTIGLAASFTFWALRFGHFEIDSPVLLWVPFAVAGGLILHALLYLALFASWYAIQQKSVAGKLLESAGRLALTNYIVQTVFGIVLFYGIGFGLAGKLNYTIMFAAGILFFILQMVFSSMWLKQFRTGPVEWLWRRLFYPGFIGIKRVNTPNSITEINRINTGAGNH